jgi:serine/threonine protein phosphatase 1
MQPRTIVIGDIHGCLAALQTILDAIAAGPQDTIITLGDYVDRGPDSRGVIERLLSLAQQTTLVPLLGNHEEMMLTVCAGRDDLLDSWLSFGGAATLASYGGISTTQFVQDYPEHLAFMQNCRLYYEAARHFFVHANYRADLPLDQQPRDFLLWRPLGRSVPGPHCSGKTAIVGHTSQKTCEILDLGYLKCIDTWCYGEGWLTAMEPKTGRVWQADKTGKARSQ